MSIQFNNTFESIDSEYGILKGNSRRENSVLWSFNTNKENHSIDIFIEGDETSLNPIYKKTLNTFLDSIQIFMKNLHIQLLDMISHDKSFAEFIEGKYLIDSISIWDEEYDVTLISMDNKQQIIVNMLNLTILDIYIENLL